ncbi:hypothetical protein CTI12_AA039530 [Artemisia annua]|uniref:Uncharacterized protein n=1 Tax=Artemisia annua TaxID=35608 RepID=A0A2U1QEI3_ARTAN|nr:hypothetical protein CTI12_AA039530 [Artemisia annua]
MGTNVTYYVDQLLQLVFDKNSSNKLDSFLQNTLPIIHEAEQQNRYSKPMPWIGIYIASASLVCILAMAVDLLHGLRNRKLWFPCNYFTLNAAYLSVVAVAIKLPMDINNSMPGGGDQAAKLGSMAFMCTVMANQMPSLGTMNNKELLANIIALVVLVITLIVNVCIQIKTGVVSSYLETLRSVHSLHLPGYIIELDIIRKTKPLSPYAYFRENRIIAIIYVAMLLVLLIIQICSALMILNSKRILESKYQAGHERALSDLELKRPGSLTTEKLKQCVGYYWVMAETGSPQFMTACSATTSASGVICALSTILHIIIMLSTINQGYASDYGWSIPVIFLTQFMGVLLGTIAPLCRCFASLSFKMSKKWIWEHMKVFKVECYWTGTLLHWKKSSIPFPFRSRKCKVALEKLKVPILSFSIGFQKTVVITCKIISLIPIFLMVFVLLCFNCWKWLKVMFKGSSTVLVNKFEQVTPDTNFNQYVLQLQVDMEPAERTLKGILKSVNRLIQKAKKQQPENLMKLLQKSSGFEGVQYFDSLPPLLSTEYPDCWSLPLLSLTTIAISLPDIREDIVDSLLRSVSEGLLYVSHVEESLNATHECVSIQKAAKMSWLEVEVHNKWLGYKFKDHVRQLNTARNILDWFRDTAKNKTEVESMEIEDSDNNLVCESACAKSMYHITTILLSYQDTNDEVSQEKLFEQLSSMISGILAACLTNLPQVIAMKCHTSSIEKREASVYAAAQLLGETTQIINKLQNRELPSLNPDEFP